MYQSPAIAEERLVPELLKHATEEHTKVNV
jgi:hypothetical protein